jgi:hypothetical protein
MLDIFQIKNGRFIKNFAKIDIRESFKEIQDILELAIE